MNKMRLYVQVYTCICLKKAKWSNANKPRDSYTEDVVQNNKTFMGFVTVYKRYFILLFGLFLPLLLT